MPYACYSYKPDTVAVQMRLVNMRAKHSWLHTEYLCIN